MDSSYFSFMVWVLALATIATGIYFYLTWNFDHFTKQNLKYIKPLPFFGSLGDFIQGRKSLVRVINEFYNLDPESKFTGFFEFRNPILLLKDPEMIKQVTIKEIDSFLDHRISADEHADPLFGKGLLSLTGKQWREMRSTLSPTFTGSKIRAMYRLINECVEDLTKYITMKTADGPAMLELKDVFGRVANDIIANSGFGVRANSFQEENPEFYEMGKSINQNSVKQTMKFFGLMSFPNVMKYLKIKFYPKNASIFFRNLIKETIRIRKQEGIIRPDMIHLLMKARKGLSVNGTHKVGEEKCLELTNDEITAQALIFFLGAFESVSTAMSFAAYELAVNPNVQRKLQEEIDEVKKLHGTISYETISGLKYLDMVVSETLRKCSPTVLTDRVCTKSYTFEDGKTKIKMEPGQSLWIPICALHHDPKYFPNPDKFDPERFSDENKHNITSGTYLPFGSGARICIGARLAIIEMKAVIFHLLSNFNINVCPKTDIPMTLAKKNILPCAEKGFWVEIESRIK